MSIAQEILFVNDKISKNDNIGVAGLPEVGEGVNRQPSTPSSRVGWQPPQRRNVRLIVGDGLPDVPRGERVEEDDFWANPYPGMDADSPKAFV